MNEFHFKGYQVASTIEQKDAEALVNAFIEKQYVAKKTMKDSSHTYVALADIGEYKDIVFKEPRQRNNDAWQRFLSLFRPGSSRRAFDGHLAAQKTGTFCPTPILAAEYKKFGMVVDGFFIYYYQEGEKLNSEDATQLVNALLELHKHGHLHGDATNNNFLKHEGNIYFIDSLFQKPLIFAELQKNIELVHLYSCTPFYKKGFPEGYLSTFSMKFAKFLYRFSRSFKQTRRNIRSFIKRR